MKIINLHKIWIINSLSTFVQDFVTKIIVVHFTFPNKNRYYIKNYYNFNLRSFYALFTKEKAFNL